MSPKYRSERWKLSYGQEATYGAEPAVANSAIYTPGIFDDATLPDPEFEHLPFWIQKTTATTDRNYSIAYRGRARYSGSIPDIVLLDGRLIYLPLADDVDHLGANPYTHTIPGTSATTSLPSLRVVATYYDDAGVSGLCRWFTGGKVNRATYHCEEGGMLMMSLDELLFNGIYFDIAGANTDLLVSPYWDTQTEYQLFNYPTTITAGAVVYPLEPFYFSECEVKFKLVRYINATTATLAEYEAPTINSFRLEVNNNITPKYYLSDLGGQNDAHGPYQLLEGHQDIRLGMNVELADYATGINKDDFFINLLRQGRETASSVYTYVKGLAVQITFTRANDASSYIRFQLPSDYTPGIGLDEQGGLLVRAPHNILTEGLVTVPIEIMCRNMGVVISDRIAGAGVDDLGYPDQNTD